MVSSVNEQLLDERLAALEEARAWSPRLISKLENHIRTADDLDMFPSRLRGRMNSRRGVVRRETPEDGQRCQ